jgi:hypothetical protein
MNTGQFMTSRAEVRKKLNILALESDVFKGANLDYVARSLGKGALSSLVDKSLSIAKASARSHTTRELVDEYLASKYPVLFNMRERYQRYIGFDPHADPEKHRYSRNASLGCDTATLVFTQAKVLGAAFNFMDSKALVTNVSEAASRVVSEKTRADELRYLESNYPVLRELVKVTEGPTPIYGHNAPSNQVNSAQAFLHGFQLPIFAISGYLWESSGANLQAA